MLDGLADRGAVVDADGEGVGAAGDDQSVSARDGEVHPSGRGVTAFVTLRPLTHALN